MKQYSHIHRLFSWATVGGLVIAVIVGCTVVPEVEYRILRLGQNERKDSWIIFQLASSAIAIGKIVEKKQQTEVSSGGVAATSIEQIDLSPDTLECSEGACLRRLIVYVSAVPFEDDTYAMEPKSPIYKTTKIAPTYFSGSLLLKTVSVETEDHRKEVIETVGSIAVGLAKSVVVPAAVARPPAEPPGTIPLNLPVVIDLDDAKEATEQPQRLPGNANWTYQFKFLDKPAETGHYQRSVLSQRDKIKSALPFSICRSAKLTIMSGTETYSFGVTVADPDFISTVPFPAKGVITLNRLCGADVALEKETVIPTKDLADALFQQIQNLRNALKKE